MKLNPNINFIFTTSETPSSPNTVMKLYLQTKVLKGTQFVSLIIVTM